MKKKKKRRESFTSGEEEEEEKDHGIGHWMSTKEKKKIGSLFVCSKERHTSFTDGTITNDDTLNVL